MRSKDNILPNWKDFKVDIDLKSEKDDFMYEEIILSNSGEKILNKEIDIETKHDKKTEENFKNFAKLNRENILKNSFLKGLLPKEADETFSNLHVVKRCCLEHCYFLRSRSYKYNLRCSSLNSSSTLQFENENSSEQQTIDCKILDLQEGSPAFLNDWDEKKNIDHKIKSRKFLRKRRYSSSSSSSGNSSSSSSISSSSTNSNKSRNTSTNRSSNNSDLDTLSLGDNSNDRDYLPEDNSSESDYESAESDSVKSLKNLNVVNSSCNNDYGFRKKKIPCNWMGVWRCQKPKIPRDFVSVHDLLTEIKTMQKLLKFKCDKKFSGEPGKTGKISSPKLKKLVNNGIVGGHYPKMSKSLCKLPNLTKMVTGEKNWRMEYMDDEIQNLGLDDLLLKASELNAENFTKALGRKLDSVNPDFNCKDTSEIVFTIPKCKKIVVHADKNQKNEETSISKTSKPIKLSVMKPCLESEQAKEKEPCQEGAKPLEDLSFKKRGIKVKTVENINEEFKDSLEVTNKIFRDGNNEASLVENKVAGGEEKEDRGEEFESKAEKGSPFVMTIIQSKSEKQRPAILRNSTYFKKKTKNLEKSKVSEISEETTDSQKKEKNDLSLFNTAKNQEGKEIQSLKPKIILEENQSAKKQRNIPFILNCNRKCEQLTDSPLLENSTPTKSQCLMPPDLVKVHEGSDKTFRVTSIEQKLMPKTVNRRFVKVVPYEPVAKIPKKIELGTRIDQIHSNVSGDELDKNATKDEKVLSLFAFSNILKDILPEKWFLCLDKKYGLQIIKTQTDEFLNPSILISVVIARCGKLTVNVRGNQLKKNHTFFSNLCSMKNSENKLSLNYVLAILNKLRCLSVCFGCDDPSLKKYWNGEGFVERHTEFNQVYRSHFCQLLVTMGKKRCYPCYRMNEALKNRYRKDKMGERSREDKEKEPSAKEVPEAEKQVDKYKGKGVKRNLEDFLEESFSTMKQQIADEIEKNKKLGERENALKAQEEVLSFMGLARKDRLDNPVRKSKRKKNSFYKFQQPVKKKIDQQELEFLEKYWADINTLFSTSLLFGAYSRTGRSRLREKCRMFHSLLSTWKTIMRTNPDWIGGEILLPGGFSTKESPEKDSGAEQFDKMDVPALRAYIINSVKEVNRLKHKLRTKNSYFKILYNKFVKRRMKKPKTSIASLEKKESSANTTNTPTPTDLSSDESTRDKEKTNDSNAVAEN